MLDHCAPGWTKTESTHYYCVMWQKGTYRSLSKGQHGKKKNSQKVGRSTVETGEVKHLIRQLGIDMDCARKYINIP